MNNNITLDRTKAPALEKISKPELPIPKKIIFPNNLPVYYLNAGEQDIIKLELIFQAGRWQEPQKLASHLMSRMLKEGTSKRTGKEIADIIALYGATLSVKSSYDNISINLICLNKHLEKVLPILKEILTEANFPQAELDLIIQNNKQQLKINLDKNDFIAENKFKELLFGANNPYGYFVKESDYDNINKETLDTFYQSNICSNNAILIVAGKISTSTEATIEKFLGQNDWKSEHEIIQNKHDIITTNNLKQHTAIKDAVQSSIRIGWHLVNKTHEDYMDLVFLHTLFGGYFGSRLMNNIREDKGYTYGIYSIVNTFLHEGYYCISTEVGKDVCQKAIDEIYNEIQKMQTETVGEEELLLVKNYLTGTLLSSVDGPFKMAATLKSLIVYGLNFEYIGHFFDAIDNMSVERLQSLANKYFIKDKMLEVVVG